MTCTRVLNTNFTNTKLPWLPGRYKIYNIFILLFIVHLTEWFEFFVEALMDLNARRSLLFVAAACSLS